MLCSSPNDYIKYHFTFLCFLSDTCAPSECSPLARRIDCTALHNLNACSPDAYFHVTLVSSTVRTWSQKIRHGAEPRECSQNGKWSHCGRTEIRPDRRKATCSLASRTLSFLQLFATIDNARDSFPYEKSTPHILHLEYLPKEIGL